MDLHGGLLGLAQLSIAYKERTTSPEERERHMQYVTVYHLRTALMLTVFQIFQCLSIIPHAVLVGPRSEIVTAAACELIAHTITVKELEDSAVPQWRKVVDHGLKHRNVVVQDAATNAMSALSSLVDCSAIVTRCVFFYLVYLHMVSLTSVNVDSGAARRFVCESTSSGSRTRLHRLRPLSRVSAGQPRLPS